MNKYQKHLMLITLACALATPAALAQSSSSPKAASVEQKPEASLPRFDLDFPGGSIRDLGPAIEKALGKPVNVIIPKDVELELPPISVRNITVWQLFNSLNGLRHEENVYTFVTDGRPDENSIWQLVLLRRDYEGVGRRDQHCRFYQLGPYLDAGYRVEDITTAVETGWKMLGETNLPSISYHKETKLLVVVGYDSDLNLIDQALSQLHRVKPEESPKAQKSENVKSE